LESATLIQKPETILGTTVLAHIVNDGLDMGLPLIMPLLVTKYALSLFEAGAILTCYAATTVIFQPLLGYISDITGYKKIYLASGLFTIGAGLFLVQFAPSLPWLLLCSFLAGLGFSTYHPAAMSFINAAYTARRGFGLGFHGVGGSLGRGVYPAALGALLAAYGLGSALFLSVAIAFTAGIMVLRLPPSMGSRKARRFSLTSTYIILVTCVAFLLRTIAYAGTVNFIPTYLVRELHLDIAAAGLATSIMLILGIVSQPLGGYLSDKLGRRAVLGMSCFLMGVFFTLFLWIPHPASLIPLSLFGFCIFLGFPLPYAIVGDHVPKEVISTSLGIVSGVGGAGGIIAPLLVGRLGDQMGLGNAMLLVAFFAFAAAASCILLPKRTHPITDSGN